MSSQQFSAHPTAPPRRSRLLIGASVVLLGQWLPLSAQAQGQPSPDDLMQMLLELKNEQAALAEKIQAVEALLVAQEKIESLPAPAEPVLTVEQNVSAPIEKPASVESVKAHGDKLNVSGDFLFRQEGNFGDNDRPVRNRSIIRGRLRAEYALNETIAIGAEVSTGDSDNPNSATITISNFSDNAEISLSRIYARLNVGPAELVGGKFANPFVHTELVWDNDVNLQGATASFVVPIGGHASLMSKGVYFIVDEASSGPESDMVGGQLAFSAGGPPNWRLDSAVAYYNYRLENLASADAGDFRSNLRDASGGYLSDFDLFNVFGAITYNGIGAQWPVRLAADYVKNLGAATAGDTGYGVDLTLGKKKTSGDWRFDYGYSQAEIDAVLAAFSHDSLTIATNYQSHKLGIDYVPIDHVQLNATLYHYKPLDAAFAGANDPDDWLERLRLNVTLSF